MANIKMGFSKPKTWKPFAWAIMFGYGIPYDHVYLEIYSVKYDRKMIYQASGTRVNFMGDKIFHDENIIIAEYPVTIPDEKYNEMMQFAIDNSGRSYGIKQAFGMAFVRVCEVLGINRPNPFKDGEQTFVCSELGAYVLKNFAHIELGKDNDDITPLDLFNYFRELKV